MVSVSGFYWCCGRGILLVVNIGTGLGGGLGSWGRKGGTVAKRGAKSS